MLNLMFSLENVLFYSRDKYIKIVCVWPSGKLASLGIE